MRILPETLDVMVGPDLLGSDWPELSADEIHQLMQDFGVDISHLRLTDTAVLSRALKETLTELQDLPFYVEANDALDPAAMAR